MSIKKSDVQTFAIGVASYYLFVFILIFYPAYVFAVMFCCVSINHLDLEVATAYLWAIPAFFVGRLVIIGLLAFEKIKTLIFIYLITAYPFYHIVLFVFDEKTNMGEFPGLNWFPW